MTDCYALRVAFAGTPEFASEALAQLIASKHSVVGVLTQPDRPAGRGRKLTASPVKKLALEHGIAVDQPKSFKDEGSMDELRRWAPDLVVVAAYGLLLPKVVLDIPPLGCLNIHGSLLPRWRGAAPIHRAVMAGDAQTGVTIMRMDEGLDTGDMLSHVTLPIQPTDTTPQLHDALARLGATALVDVLTPWCEGKVSAVVQPEEGITYAHKLEKAEGVIDFSQTALDCDRAIRGLAGWPIAESVLDGERIRLHASRLSAMPLKDGVKPGTVVSTENGVVSVATGNGVVDLTRLQRPGKKAIEAADFIRGANLTGRTFGG